MALYSLNGELPEALPFRIYLTDSDGLVYTRTDPESFTPEEIALAGNVEVSDPPETPENHSVSWSGTEWIVTDNTEALQAKALSTQIATNRSNRNALLKLSDVYIIKAYESGEAVSEDLKTYRQALRDIPQQEDQFNVLWPIDPITGISSDPEVLGDVAANG